MQTLVMSLSKKYLKSYSGLSKPCWRGIIFSLIESTLAGVFYYLSIYFIHDLHTSIPTSGMIISCYGVGAVIGGMIGGNLSDRIAPAYVSSISLLIQSISYLALIKLKSIHLLMGDVLILGIATYGFITANHLWVLNRCENHAERIKAINLLATASNLGLGLSAVFIGYFEASGFKYIFMLTGVLLFVLSGYIFSVEKIFKKSSSAENVVADKNNHNVPSNRRNKIVIWVACLSVLFIGTIVSQISSTYPIYIQFKFADLGLRATSILFLFNSLLVVFCSAAIGEIINDYNKILMVGIGGFLIGIGMLLLNVASIFTLAILSCFIYTLGEIIFFSMVQFVFYQKGAAKQKGKSLGLFRMTYATSRIIGPVSGGYIYHSFGGNMLWGVCGILGVGCLIACISCRHYD